MKRILDALKISDNGHMLQKQQFFLKDGFPF
jgi:hypothetical protein